jgi:C4-dicarboxylate transporter/malic acid transport protein
MQDIHPIKYFVPGWFAVIMGTGGLGNIIFLWQHAFPAAKYLGMGVALVADILYFIVLIIWLLRLYLFLPYVLRDLAHPIQSNFFVTMPIATAILGTNLYIVWSQYLNEYPLFITIFTLWVISSVLVLALTFLTTFKMMQSEIQPSPETMNFSWIMAPIANMAVLLIGNPVLNLTIKYRPDWSMSVLTANLVLGGIGFFLFIFISGIIFVRLIQHPLPPSETTPTFGIILSAVGLAVSATIDTAQNAKAIGIVRSVDFAYLGAAVIWGFGLWILGIIIIICLYQMRRGGIPFTLAWWAFIFPLAAYTLSTQKIAAYFTSSVTSAYSVFLTALLVALWIFTSFYTIKGVLSGTFFTGTPIESVSGNEQQARSLWMRL